ncbi:MAG: cyclic nucleotide-binding domain-containing protein [Chrysiogenetes bacterium]|nr:cyclic nucleotide-binding domain-containing protein [Chrysiogenetes bacterium]
MKVSPVSIGCVHLSHGEFNAVFGCPSESLKTILSNGLAMPECFVVPDTFHHQGTSLIAIEFPFYHFLFIQGGLQHGRKFRVIGSKDACDRVHEMLRVTLLGPTDAEMKRWKVNKRVREMLRTDLDYLALKNGEGRILNIDDMIDFVHYDDQDKALLCGEGSDAAWVKRLGEDRYAILGGNGTKKNLARVEIPLDGHCIPPYEITMSQKSALPANLSVTVLGASHGFDPNNPTTCYLLGINGVNLLWDASPFTMDQLRARGVPKESIKGIILSHVHDDHCSFLEFLLDKERPTVITTVEVFECLLIKMGAILGESPDQVRDYIDFVEIKAGKPTKLYGAEFKFFYGVHAIPAFGAEISVEDKHGKPHRVYISGDTLHFRGLAEMAQARLIAPERRKELEGFLKQNWDLCVLDGGGEPIHMAVEDYEDSKLPIVITHRPTWDGKMGPKTCVAKPGQTFEIIPAEPVHPFHAQAIFESMQLFEIQDKTWIDVLLARGRVRDVKPGEVVVEEGTVGDTFYFVLSGHLSVESGGESLASLDRGDFFGEIAILKKQERTASVVAEGPCTLFELPGSLFMDFVDANDLEEDFSRLWRDRQAIQEVELFAGLDASATHRITLESEAKSFKKDEEIVNPKNPKAGRDYFIVKKGAVRLYEKGKLLKDKRGKPLLVKPGQYFGRHVMVNSTTLRSYTAVANVGTELLVLDKAQLDALQEEMPLIKHRIRLTMDERASTQGTSPAPRRFPLSGKEARRLRRVG